MTSIKISLILNRLISNVYPNKNAIIIAGLGRCGTTLLFNSISKNHYYKKHNDLIDFKSLINFKKGTVYKTHDFPPLDELPSYVKVIFMYGNVYNTIISSHRRINEWSKSHHKHLGSIGYIPNNDIFYRDSLGLSKQFSKWKATKYLKIRYEDIYKKETILEISSLLGFKLNLEEEVKRKTDFKTHLFKVQLLKVYANLQNELDQL